MTTPATKAAGIPHPLEGEHAPKQDEANHMSKLLEALISETAHPGSEY